MPKIEAFEKYSKEYDEWFIRNKNIYLAELNLIKEVVPSEKIGIEIGIGTGRFATSLGIKIGIDPSKKMLKISKERRFQIFRAIAENLPFKDETFDFGLMVTTICFVDDILKSFMEIHRILKTEGFIVVGFVDKDSKLGIKYQLKKKRSKFYGDAEFYSVNEVINYLRKAHFRIIETKQTIFYNSSDKIDSVKNGYGEGSFVVIKASKITP